MRSRLEPMKKVARMLRAHEPLILNWFRAKGEISNGSDPPGRPACRPQLPHRVVAEERREQGTDRRQVGELLGRRRRDARRDQAAGHLLAPRDPPVPHAPPAPVTPTAQASCTSCAPRI